MEMKLNPQRIKSLRLTRSWSQENLAEAAGLNPRTIQRVEAEGSASLNTRLHIAKALGVEPGELDMPEAAAALLDGGGDNSRPRFAYHLPILLLISLVYLAWTPIYFSLSRSNFQSLGPDAWTQLRAVVLLAFWFCLALPWMGFVYLKRRSQLRLHMAYLGTLLLFSVLTALQPILGMSALSIALYLSGLALLYICYREGEHRARVRHVVFGLLATYLFVWLVEGTLTSFVLAARALLEQGKDIPAPWVSFPSYVLRKLALIPQLFPVALALLFDLGRPRANSSQPGAPKRDAENFEASLTHSK